MAMYMTHTEFWDAFTFLYSLYPQINSPNSKVQGAYMGTNWGRQDPGGPHVGPMILAIWMLVKRPLPVYCCTTV